MVGKFVKFVLPKTSMNSTVFSIPWISFNGSKICVDKSVVLCPLQGSINYEFGKVINILSNRERLLLVCRLFFTKKFSITYQAFEVLPTEKILVYDSVNINLATSFYLHRPSFATGASNRSWYIIAKQNLICELMKNNK